MKKWKRLLFLKIARRLSRNNNSIPVPTIISAKTSIKGDIISDGILHVDGHVQGDITCAELVIGIRGSVTGCVTTQTMHLYGTLRGKALVESMFISKSASLIGDVTHHSIAIEPGAFIDGHCIRAGAPIPAEQAKPDLMLVDNSSLSNIITTKPIVSKTKVKKKVS